MADNISASEESLKYENADHFAYVLKSMREMYEKGILCDVTLRIEDRKFHCHRNVLAATSPYFWAMFTTNLTDKHQDEITIHEVDALSVSLVINYAYTGTVEITKTNAENLLAVASLLQVAPVYKACAKFMESQLDVQNCVGIHYFAQRHCCTELQVKAKEHIEKHFTAVSQMNEFLHLDAKKLIEIISSNELNVEREEFVFETVMRWINSDKDKNSKNIADILKHIRFGLLPSKYIKDCVLTNPTVLSSNQCCRLLDDLRDYEQNPEAYTGDVVFISALRSGMIKPELCVLLIGGEDNERPSINCYNPLTREAYYMSDLSCRDQLSGYYDVQDPGCIVTEDNLVFVAGGKYVYHEHYGESQSDDSFDEAEEDVVQRDVFQYDNDHDVWVARSPMMFPKCNFGMAAVEGKIFCFGGLTLNDHATEIIEKYDIQLDRWSYVGMMPMPLVDLCAVVSGAQVYLLGGRTGVGAHNGVARYDTRSWEWTSLAGMPTPRFNFGACLVDGEIYVAGGQIYAQVSHVVSREALNSVEIYSIEQNMWRQGPNLPDSMYNVGLFRIGGFLYACGTTEFHRTAYRVYRYNDVYRLDLSKQTWEQLENDLCDITNYSCAMAKMHTRKLSQVFRPEVDT